MSKAATQRAPGPAARAAGTGRSSGISRSNSPLFGSILVSQPPPGWELMTQTAPWPTTRSRGVPRTSTVAVSVPDSVSIRVTKRSPRSPRTIPPDRALSDSRVDEKRIGWAQREHRCWLVRLSVDADERVALGPGRGLALCAPALPRAASPLRAVASEAAAPPCSTATSCGASVSGGARVSALTSPVSPPVNQMAPATRAARRRRLIVETDLRLPSQSLFDKGSGATTGSVSVACGVGLSSWRARSVGGARAAGER